MGGIFFQKEPAGTKINVKLLNPKNNVSFKHSFYLTDDLEINKISYNFNLRHVSKTAKHLQKKSKMVIRSFKNVNEEGTEGSQWDFNECKAP